MAIASATTASVDPSTEDPELTDDDTAGSDDDSHNIAVIQDTVPVVATNSNNNNNNPLYHHNNPIQNHHIQTIPSFSSSSSLNTNGASGISNSFANASLSSTAIATTTTATTTTKKIHRPPSLYDLYIISPFERLDSVDANLGEPLISSTPAFPALFPTVERADKIKISRAVHLMHARKQLRAYKTFLPDDQYQLLKQEKWSQLKSMTVKDLGLGLEHGPSKKPATTNIDTQMHDYYYENNEPSDIEIDSDHDIDDDDDEDANIPLDLGDSDEEDDDEFDPNMVCDYSDDVFRHMLRLEVAMAPSPVYMDRQPELDWAKRAILVEWLVQVHGRFRLLPETLYLTINYVDRFLTLKSVTVSNLQLVGAVALFLAAKYEEITCPSVNEIVYMVDNGYSDEDILRAEKYMIKLLDFKLSWPGPMSFLRRTSKADEYDLEIRTLAKYLLEVTLMDDRFVCALPSWTAASAYYLAKKMLNRGSWDAPHIYYSGYTEEQLLAPVSAIIDCCRNPLDHHKAIFDKYCDRRFKKAALFVADYMRGL